MKKSTLVIATYNWPEALNLCLKSVLCQSVLPSQVIIADDGSDDRTKNVIANFVEMNRVEIKHVWHEDLGFRKTEVLNKAVKQADSDYIIQIDGDVILDKHFIADHLKQMEDGMFVRASRAHITERLLPILYVSQKIDFKFYSKGIRNRFNALRIPWLVWLVKKVELSGENVRGSNFAYWKSDFIKVNGYNNDLKGWGHEDEELATRLVNNGVFKKNVKLCCIQYHIFHKLASRALTYQHRNSVLKVRENKILSIMNGYMQV